MRPRVAGSGPGQRTISLTGRRARREQAMQRRAARELGGLGDVGNVSAGIRPTGRAPRGRGPEFAARRQIADRMDAIDRQRDTLRRSISQYRGQGRRAGRVTSQRERLAVLDQAARATRRIAQAPGDWVFKAELIRDVNDSLLSPLVGSSL